ncbi:MAG: YeeE/YedE family protein [Acidobacteria bacterium]|nr:YeeE/YedE family protein [Acidobacteriota bacterium]MCA1650085.1 YeeE/YedE family protein [Acidobacteriota bacterium]
MFESPDTLALGLITGVAFGFLLQKGGVANYQTILGQLLLRNWTVVKIMGTAIAVGAVGVYALVGGGAATLDIWSFQIGGVIVGALLFGVGLAVFGYCPGTSVTASGQGSRDAMMGVAGMAVGAGVFVAAYPSLEPVINGFGDVGKITLVELLGVSPWTVILALVVMVTVALWLVERHEGSGTRPPPAHGETALKPRPAAPARERSA